ncbi:MAG: hypothetical protein WC242_03090 [Candidatus Paceibacterota bacterium]|jgi:hypothetical protein
MPWWGWLLILFFTVLVGLILKIRSLLREFICAFLNVMDLSGIEWYIPEEEATKTEGT